jgi:hypothetical protein
MKIEILAMRCYTLLIVLAAAVAGSAQSAELKYKQRLLAELAKQVPAILKQNDAQTGRFGRGIWICDDQNLMYPLAVAYATPGSGNRYYHDRAVLEVLMKAGDALIADMDDRGQWMFRKKDGSTWGMTRKCWVYSRWIRTFALIQSDMPPDRRAGWTKALTLGYTAVAKSDLGSLVNIPTHHAMGLYIAGKTLHRPEWCQRAADFLMKVVAAQNEAGYWSEGGGPVVLYDFVYVEALGIYYAASGDRRVLPALEKAARFHSDFTYPDGRCVETIDQRNPYHDSVELGNVGFTFSPIGRGWRPTRSPRCCSMAKKGRWPTLPQAGSRRSPRSRPAASSVPPRSIAAPGSSACRPTPLRWPPRDGIRTVRTW